MAVRDVLFELLTEELPPRALLGLSQALTDGLVKGLDGAGIQHGRSQGFATPRRLAVRIDACAEFAADRQVERRGPPLSNSFDAAGAPMPAAVAFAKSCGVAVEHLSRLTTDKGAWIAFRGTLPGVATTSLLGGLIVAAVAALPIPKRMRWGSRTTEFVRPVRSVLLLFGAEVVPIDVLGLRSDRVSVGHRFHAPRPLTIKSARSYAGQLRRAKVIADFDERRAVIRDGVTAAAAASGGRALIDAALLDEVTALVEWPVPIVGHFEARFLDLPREIVIATVQDHQRYFPIEAADGRLSGGFVTVSNLQSLDPAKVREGNERVVRPRLSDAAFFWEQDRALSLAVLAQRLDGVTFQNRLGTYADKTLRVRMLAEHIGRRIHAGDHVGRAATLAKADLMSSLVGEFPELQGTIGRYLAAAQGEPADVAHAIEEQYRPRYAGDALPASKTGKALAIADKLDTLTGIFALENLPTGTKDPFGLRRAALGVLRILLEGHLELDLVELVERATAAQPVQRDGVAAQVYEFLTERLRGLWLERSDGSTPEMIDAILALQPSSPLDADHRLQALKVFMGLPEAAVLTAMNKRIANILRKAPAHDALSSAALADSLAEPAEQAVHQVLSALRVTVTQAVEEKRYADALTALIDLRAPVDEFFDKLMVMDEDAAIRSRRLALLHEVHSLLRGVADLSRLPG